MFAACRRFLPRLEAPNVQVSRRDLDRPGPGGLDSLFVPRSPLSRPGRGRGARDPRTSRSGGRVARGCPTPGKRDPQADLYPSLLGRELACR